jgi:hypothetical protein
MDAIVDQIEIYASNDSHTMETQDIPDLRSLYQLSSYKYIENFVRDETINAANMFILKDMLESRELYSQVIFLFNCLGIPGCL